MKRALKLMGVFLGHYFSLSPITYCDRQEDKGHFPVLFTLIETGIIAPTLQTGRNISTLLRKWVKFVYC